MRLQHWRRAALAAALMLPVAAVPRASAEMQYTALEFSRLPGWNLDDHDAALRVFAASCDRIRSADSGSAERWRRVCDLAKSHPEPARRFFEDNFQPVISAGEASGLLTGYFEPELAGALERDYSYRYPLYRPPPDLPPGRPWKTRAEIEAGALAGRGLELVWLRDPVDAFFVHVQGSARIHLREGGNMRVGFAGRNGHVYRSVGREAARLGLMAPNRVSAGRIRDYVRRQPETGRRLLNHNPSYIFFREIAPAAESDGPVGAMGVPVTAMRSLAVDPEFIPLGAPVWVEMKESKRFPRLMVAQDVGSAIKGAQRGDIFFGTGGKAGKQAGRVRNAGRLVVLMPKPADPELPAGD